MRVNPGVNSLSGVDRLEKNPNEPPPRIPIQRPVLGELLESDFDRPAAMAAQRTLIICSGPRTGSTELCRYLIGAGIGVPHEYFNPNFARPLAQRWAITGPLHEPEIGRYIDVLRRRRSQNGVFATKMQFWQFDRTLRNGHGAALFADACVVHLFRPDAARQFASYRAAMQSGVWDYRSRKQSGVTEGGMAGVARNPEGSGLLRQALGQMDWILRDDIGFRTLFVLLGITPLFVTSDELFSDPARIVRRIGEALAVAIDEEGLRRAIIVSAPYGRDRQREESMAGLKELFKKIAFSETAQPRLGPRNEPKR